MNEKTNSNIRGNLNESVKDFFSSPIIDAIDEKDSQNTSLMFLESIVFFINLIGFGYGFLGTKTAYSMIIKLVTYFNSIFVSCLQFAFKCNTFRKIKNVPNVKCKLMKREIKFKSLALFALITGWILIIFTLGMFCIIIAVPKESFFIHGYVIILLIDSILYYVLDKIIWNYFSVNNSYIKELINSLNAK